MTHVNQCLYCSPYRVLDFINLMSYDFHGSWDKVTGYHSALYPGKAEVGQQAALNQVGHVNTEDKMCVCLDPKISEDN